jgi:hypothetical protein
LLSIEIDKDRNLQNLSIISDMPHP